jgi:hypothetical protein
MEINVPLLDSDISEDNTDLSIGSKMKVESPFWSRKPMDRIDLIERLKRTKSPLQQDHQGVSRACFIEDKVFLATPFEADI